MYGNRLKEVKRKLSEVYISMSRLSSSSSSTSHDSRPDRSVGGKARQQSLHDPYTAGLSEMKLNGIATFCLYLGCLLSDKAQIYFIFSSC